MRGTILVKKKIIVVEDESIVRLDIIDILKSANYEVVGAAGNGEKAIELAYAHKPDLIIMDIKMPKLDGLKASEIINKQSHTPILLLTAYSQKEFVERAKQDNIVGYIVKPFSENRLIPAVEIALQQSENKKGLRKEVLVREKELDKRKLVEKAKGIIMENENLSENNAYEKIRKISMDKQVNLEQIAKAIINKSE